MPTTLPMTPTPAGTIIVAATDASARRALPGTSATTSQGASRLRQYIVSSSPASASIAYLRFLAADSGTAVIPTTGPVLGDVPIFPGSIQTFTADATYIATICPTSGTATLYVTAGDGV